MSEIILEFPETPQLNFLIDLNGESLYNQWLILGNTGDYEAFLVWLQGSTAYEVAVLNGFIGTQAQWLESLEGTSAYEIAVQEGFVGTQAQWIASLKVGIQDSMTSGVTDKAPSQDAVLRSLALKANLDSPTFTGNVSGITRAMIGLSDADNTSDVNKPISTAVQTALSGKQATSTKNQANGYAGLGSDGKLISSQLPSITISDTSVVSTQSAMLAITAETGDVAVRTDLNKSFILKGTDPTILSHWQELLTPTSDVTSVFGRTGPVTAGAGDYNADQITETTTRKFQTANQKAYNDATSSIQTQINGKQATLGYTPENVANKSDSYTASSSTTYASTKALVDGLALKANLASPTFTGTVSGTAAAFSSFVDLLGFVTTGNNFMSNTGGIFFNGYNNFQSGIFSNNSGTGLSFQTGGNTNLTLSPSGAATFASSVTTNGNMLIQGASVNSKLWLYTNYSGNSVGASFINSSGSSTIELNGNTGAATFASSVSATGFEAGLSGETTFIGSKQTGNIMQIGGSQELRLQTYSGGWQNRLTIANGGNVGIGTEAPNQLLHIEKDQNTYTNLRVRNNDAGSSAYTMIALNSSGNNWGMRMGSSAANSNRLDFVIDAFGSPVERLSITSGGNVGIGTTSPAQKLDVVGNIQASGFVGSGTGINQAGLGSGNLNFYNASASPKYIQLSDDSSTINAVGFSKSGSASTTWFPSGNVGIGTTSPTSKLQVVGIPEYASNALAITGGLTVGAFYHTAGVLKVVI